MNQESETTSTYPGYKKFRMAESQNTWTEAIKSSFHVDQFTISFSLKVLNGQRGSVLTVGKSIHGKSQGQILNLRIGEIPRILKVLKGGESVHDINYETTRELHVVLINPTTIQITQNIKNNNKKFLLVNMKEITFEQTYEHLENMRQIMGVRLDEDQEGVKDELLVSLACLTVPVDECWDHIPEKYISVISKDYLRMAPIYGLLSFSSEDVKRLGSSNMIERVMIERERITDIKETIPFVRKFFETSI